MSERMNKETKRERDKHVVTTIWMGDENSSEFSAF